MTARTGKCLCGAVRFEAEEVATEFSACHCDMCQRWSSGPFFSTTVGKVRFTGEKNLKRFRSSEWAERGFCSVCGSNLFFRVLEFADHEVCVGAFDERNDLVMTGEIFVDRKPDGYALAGDHPRLTEKETLEKYRGLAG